MFPNQLKKTATPIPNLDLWLIQNGNGIKFFLNSFFKAANQESGLTRAFGFFSLSLSII